MSKLGLHVHAWNNNIFEYCKNVGAPVIKSLDHNPMYVNEIKKAQPKAILLARYYVGAQLLDDPIGRARQFTSDLLRAIEGCDYDAAEGYNEWDGDLQYHQGSDAGLGVWKRYADFEAERSRLLHREGLKSAVGGCSVGTPPEHWFSAFRPALEEGDFLHLHEYSAPRMWDAVNWHCLKYRHVYEYLREHSLPILGLIISECGIDGGVCGRPKEGWRKFGLAPRQYMEDWKWMDARWMEDRYVVGGCAYDCGSTAGMGWLSFNMDPEMLPLWARCAREQGITYWEPEEEKMVIPDWLGDVRDTLKKHSTKTYERRGLGEIDTIVVHHTATMMNTPEEIANYHVDHLDWPGAGYHLYIRKSGAAYLLNDLEAISYQCYNHNRHTVGLGFEGDFTRHSHTSQQIAVGRLAVEWLWEVMGKHLAVKGHKTMPDNSTACPGAFPVHELTDEAPEPDLEVENKRLRALMTAARNTLNEGLS